MGSGISQSAPVPQKVSISRQDFIFSSKIGEGGFSNVLAGMHIPSRTWLAIKETSISSILKLEAGLSMLASEVDILSSLGDIPFIINMLFAFYDVKNMYIVLDLHRGADLRYHIRKRHVINEHMAAYLVICMSAALHHIHSTGVLHRDVKPENIVFSACGTPHLTDFGVSYQHENKDTEIICTRSCGTRQYLAPEVFTKHNRHGIEADFWSLGVVLYEVLYSRRPFHKHCPLEMIKFQDDLYQHEVFLSSSSVEFVGRAHQHITSPPLTRRRSFLQSRQSLESLKEEDDDGKDPLEEEEEEPKDEMNPTSPQHDDNNKSNKSTSLTAAEDAFVNHWLFVSRTIRSHAHLSGKLNHLQQQAAADLVLEAEDYSPRGDSFRHKCVFYDTRHSLPHSLRPACPRYTRAHGQVSHACVAVMEGLLDVRLWSRLGAGRNFQALQTHAWFQELGLEWSAVVAGDVPPPFVPDTTLIAQNLANTYRYHHVDNTQTKEQKQRYERDHKKLPPLTIEEGKILKQFYYVAPKFQQELRSSIIMSSTKI